jgi:hypothetical protein
MTLDGSWQPPSAPWSPPAPHNPEADRARHPWRVVAVVMVVVVLVAGVVGVVATRRDDKQHFPKSWDPRIARIAATVAKLRGLQFEHPVAVHFLGAKAFEKELGYDERDSSRSDKEELARETGVMRAVGLLAGKVDLAKAVSNAGRSGTLAFYSFKTKVIVVRGSTLDVAHRVTLAHELTHVLQDQHFDLAKLHKRAADSDTGDESALLALVEGDAVRIEDKYKARLSKADRRAYDQEQQAEAKRVTSETKSVPDIVTLLFSAPYEFGPATLSILEHTGGNRAIDEALQGPVPSSRVFILPAALNDPIRVAPPSVPPGSKAVGEPETFGAFETYLMLATRIDPQRALEAADVVEGGRAEAFRTRNKLCYVIAFAATGTSNRAFLSAALTAWAGTMPSAQLTGSGSLLRLTTCDPGARAKSPAKDRVNRAAELVAFRSGLTESAVGDGANLSQARCFARLFVRVPGMLDLVKAIGSGGRPDTAQTARIQAAARPIRTRCDDDADSGMP